MGKVTLPISIGPMTFDITFQVRDIWPAYSCLLGRPWIHVAGAIPSSLHQKVKFIVDGQLISVMGEKEIMVCTPFLTEYIEEDEEALETSFQALEIIGTTSIETRRGDIKPSKAVIIAAKVLITNGFKPGKRLGRIDGMANPMAIQENPRRAGLGYSMAARKAKLGWKVQSKQQARTSLYCCFICGGIVTPEHVTMVEDQSMRRTFFPTFFENAEKIIIIPNTENFPQINNAVLALDDADKSSRQDEEEETEEEALKELERLLEQQRPKLQSSTKELEINNLGKGEETREIRIDKLISPDFKQKLTKLLKEYEDIFAWSYRDMPGLDTAIVEHRLPLIPNVILVRQQLRRMKPEVALKIKEWKAGFLIVAKYPQWVANIVPVPKKDGKVDLNRASPKDNFPLPHIDLLVDNTA
ncbi:hypothetical protein CR513_16662, partial [Mucuna pruriens]